MIKGFYRLGRPINALAGCLAVFVSGYVAGTPSWLPVILAATAVLMITVSTNAWNDYIDIEIDRINKPQRPLPSGEISPQQALIFFITGSILSLVVAAFVNQQAFYIATGANILLYLYSWKLKCTVLWGNSTVATVVALCFIFGGVAAGNIQPTVILAVTVFFAIVAREILKTMADYKGDLQYGCRTISTAWGKQVACKYLKTFLGITSLVMLATFFIEQYNLIYLLIIVFLIYPLFIYIAIRAEITVSEKKLERLSLIMKYGFFAWFLAVILGAS